MEERSRGPILPVTPSVLPGWRLYPRFPTRSVVTGLEGYYRFDGSMTDTSGNGRHGTAIAISYAAGKLGQCLDSGDMDADLGRPFSGFDPNTGNLSFAAWLQTGTGGQIVGLDASPFSPQIAASQNGGVSMAIGGGLTLSATAFVGAWSHVVGVYSGGVAKLYLNGSLENSGSVSGLGVTDGTLTAGTSGVPGGSGVDEVAVYSVALSAQQVAALYNSGSGFDPTA